MNNNKKKQRKESRKLKQAKQGIGKELRRKDMSKDRILLLKEQKKLILEYIDNEHISMNQTKTEKIVEEIKSQGGVDSTTFWETKTLKNRREMHRIIHFRFQNS